MTSDNAKAYISLGSNLGDRAGNLLTAIREMRKTGFVVTRLSSIFETEPVGTFPQPPFLNMVAELDVDSLPPPENFLKQLLQIERSLGRTRDLNKGPRTIDLDLLFYGDETCESETLTLPHPLLDERRFVLVPLVELNPDLVHPRLQRTAGHLLQNTADKSRVEIWREAQAP